MSVRTGFVVDFVALRQSFSEYFDFTLPVSIYEDSEVIDSPITDIKQSYHLTALLNNTYY